MFETVTPGISGHTAQAEPTAAAIAKRFSALALHVGTGSLIACRVSDAVRKPMDVAALPPRRE